MEKSTIAIIITVITIASFMLEKIPLAVTAVSSSVLMGITGCMPLNQVVAGYSTAATIMVAGMMVVGIAMFQTGLARVIGLAIANSSFAKNERSFTFAITTICCIFTAFLSNSAVIAMFVPIIAAAAKRSNGRIKEQNITMMAGMSCAIGASLTMVGSTAQVVGQNILVKAEGGRALEFFEMAKINGILCIAFIIYCVTIGNTIASKNFNFEPPEIAEPPVMNEKVGFTWQMWVTIATVVFCVYGFVVNLWNVGIIAFFACCVLMVTKSINYKQAMKEMDWNTLVILGAIQGFAVGLEMSGGGKVIAMAILELFGGASASPYHLLVVAVVLTAVLTNFMSNTALVIMMLPLFIPIANALNVSMIPFAVAIIVSANNAISTPIGTPCVTQTLPVGYRYNDYVKLGTPINIICVILTCIFMPMLYSW